MIGTLATIVGVVVVASLVLYIVDRKSRGEPLDMTVAAKIASFSGLATGGIVFALQSDAVSDAVAVVTDTAQDMFVGTPSF